MFEKILVVQLGSILFILSHEKGRPYYIKWGGAILAAATVFYGLGHIGAYMGGQLTESLFN